MVKQLSDDENSVAWSENNILKVKGSMSAAFLAGLEEDLGQPIGHYFDLIADASMGGIIAVQELLCAVARHHSPMTKPDH